ncbi:uncharacterized protein CIMG_11317 [Coccidioides immitis RS]|uniref:Uncharacterized protein n=1 Tax=Coccidioides immitis (strain RS) TaxID=246410 RepID=A0A0D8JUF7_COCIM|nr:uncharacterized protein CIMG_11317 [Coccidioides immitis RS]KJF60980.1 hypothetical protein CIMG_11317 [Coccidioides immitis RS]
MRPHDSKRPPPSNRRLQARHPANLNGKNQINPDAIPPAWPKLSGIPSYPPIIPKLALRLEYVKHKVFLAPMQSSRETLIDMSLQLAAASWIASGSMVQDVNCSRPLKDTDLRTGLFKRRTVGSDPPPLRSSSFTRDCLDDSSSQGRQTRLASQSGKRHAGFSCANTLSINGLMIGVPEYRRELGMIACYWTPQRIFNQGQTVYKQLRSEMSQK